MQQVPVIPMGLCYIKLILDLTLWVGSLDENIAEINRNKVILCIRNFLIVQTVELPVSKASRELPWRF